jgi:type IV secretory pathway TrbL component
VFPTAVSVRDDLMHAGLEWFSSLGAGAALLAIAVATFAGAIAAGHYAFKFTNKTWIAWTVGVLAFVIIFEILGPTYDAVKRVSCRGTSYQACMDDEWDGN